LFSAILLILKVNYFRI